MDCSGRVWTFGCGRLTLSSGCLGKAEGTQPGETFLGPIASVFGPWAMELSEDPQETCV